jgi:hypothetical protein
LPMTIQAFLFNTTTFPMRMIVALHVSVSTFVRTILSILCIKNRKVKRLFTIFTNKVYGLKHFANSGFEVTHPRAVNFFGMCIRKLFITLFAFSNNISFIHSVLKGVSRLASQYCCSGNTGQTGNIKIKNLTDCNCLNNSIIS